MRGVHKVEAGRAARVARCLATCCLLCVQLLLQLGGQLPVASLRLRLRLLVLLLQLRDAHVALRGVLLLPVRRLLLLQPHQGLLGGRARLVAPVVHALVGLAQRLHRVVCGRLLRLLRLLGLGAGQRWQLPRQLQLRVQRLWRVLPQQRLQRVMLLHTTNLS